ncbi:MAG: molybdenum cofactor biosynthesis protein MoaD, partial [Phototrophicales bacterium]
MPHVKFTKHLQQFFPDLRDGSVEGATVAEVIRKLNQRYPGIAAYIVDERGRLRQHVNIFLDDEMIYDRESLSDMVSSEQ